MLVSRNGTATVHVDGTLRVRNLAPERVVSLTGINAVGTDGEGLIVSGCIGSVCIRDGVFNGASAPYLSSPWNGAVAVRVLTSDDVVFTACSMQGGNPGWDNNAGSGGDGMYIGESRVSLYECSMQGAAGSTEDSPGASGWSGGSGIRATGPGRVYAASCSMMGADGGVADWDVSWWTNEYGYGGAGGSGYFGSGIETWFLDCSFIAGHGGSSPDPTHSGYDGTDYNTGTLMPGTAPLLWATPLMNDESAVDLHFSGTPGDQVSLRIATRPGYSFSPQLGPLLLRRPQLPALAPWMIMGTIGAAGTLQRQVNVRDLPAFGHQSMQLQARVTGTAPYYTSPSWTVVLDFAW